LNFDADREQQKGNANFGQKLNSCRIVNQFEAERPDNNAGDEKTNDGGQFDFIKDVNNRDREAENNDQLMKKI